MKAGAAPLEEILVAHATQYREITHPDPLRGGSRRAAPAVVTLAVHPIHYMGSMAYHYPPDVRKYEIIGALFGEPYRVARCGTAELDVPEGAEIVIEGKILNDVREPEGPFGEFTGYASYRRTENVFVAERIQMRRDAVFHSIASGTAADHILISCVAREVEILNSLRRNLPNVIAVHVPTVTCGALMAIVQMKKPPRASRNRRSWRPSAPRPTARSLSSSTRMSTSSTWRM